MLKPMKPVKSDLDGCFKLKTTDKWITVSIMKNEHNRFMVRAIAGQFDGFGRRTFLRLAEGTYSWASLPEHGSTFETATEAQQAFCDTVLPETYFTGWMFTDQTRFADCPKCGATKGFICRTPTNRRTTYPHSERDLKSHPEYNQRNYLGGSKESLALR